MRGHSLRLSWSFLVFLIYGTSALFGQSNVLTWHNDTRRSGENSTETVLAQSKVNQNQFGKICSTPPGSIDGQIYAQPLVVTGTIAGYNHVVYVVTMNDSLYVFDGDSSNCAQINKVSLLPANEEAVPCQNIGDGQCRPIYPSVGILGTPVVSTVTNSIYVVTYSQSTAESCSTNPPPSCFVHRLHALDLSTLKEKFKGPVTIAGSAGILTFDSKSHIQRPGLLIVPQARSNGDAAVYVGFSMMDTSPSLPNGWIFGFDAKNLSATPYVFSTTSSVEGGGGGVWQSGAGLAASPDSPNGSMYIYLTTGDGVFDGASGGNDYGDSFLKLTPDLRIADYFTPFDQTCMEQSDKDLGSGGVMLLPNGLLSTQTYYAIAAGKEGNIYVMDRAHPGGYNPPTGETCPLSGSNLNLETFSASKNAYHTTPTYWNANLFYAGDLGPLRKYLLSTRCSPGPVCTTPLASSSFKFRYGTVPVTSSNANLTGTAVVWAVQGSGWPNKNRLPEPAVLYAFDAEHISGNKLPELWDSGQCPARDAAGNSLKFVVPTVANGRVYLGSMDSSDTTNTLGELDVYGLTTAPCDSKLTN